MMLQKIILRSKKKSPDQGFLTIEVIAATLVAFGFLMFSLQALAAAMLMKIQAQQDQRADQLIQEDIERIGGLSSTLTLDLDNQLANNLPTRCDVANYDLGYGDALWDALIAQTPNGDPDLDTLLLPDSGGLVTLRLSRTHLDANPHRTLKIFYQVTNSNNNVFDDDVVGDIDDDVIVTTRYVEIIPDEALRCP